MEWNLSSQDVKTYKKKVNNSKIHFDFYQVKQFTSMEKKNSDITIIIKK